MPLEWRGATPEKTAVGIAYRSAFAQYMKAQGWNADTITTRLAALRAYAGKQALEATYRRRLVTLRVGRSNIPENILERCLQNAYQPSKKTSALRRNTDSMAD